MAFHLGKCTSSLYQQVSMVRSVRQLSITTRSYLFLCSITLCCMAALSQKNPCLHSWGGRSSRCSTLNIRFLTPFSYISEIAGGLASRGDPERTLTSWPPHKRSPLSSGSSVLAPSLSLSNSSPKFNSVQSSHYRARVLRFSETKYAFPLLLISFARSPAPIWM